MKIKSITFDRSPRIPGLRAGDLVTVECENPPEALKDWRVILRGPTLFLISPIGWCGKPRSQWDTKAGPVTVAEVPREHCCLQWTADNEADIETVLKGGRFDAQPPLGWKPAPPEEKSLLAQLPASAMGDA